MAPVAGTTVLQNPVAQRIMQQRIMHATAPTTVAGVPATKPMIREVKHPGRYIRNLRQAGETFRQTFYRETGIWIPGRLPREEEIRLAAKGAKKTYEIMRGSIKLLRTKIMGRLENTRPSKIENWG